MKWCWIGLLLLGSFISEAQIITTYAGCSSNTVSGAYSAILGGSDNTVSAAYSYAGIVGCNISAVSSCALHANNFVAQNMPTFAGAPGSGCFWYQYVASLGGCVVMTS